MSAGPRIDSAPIDARIEFAHLTDPHLTSLVGAVVPRSDKRLLGWLSWRRRRRFRHLPEVLARMVADIDAARVRQRVVTGDLTHIGLPSELAAAGDWLRSLGSADDVTVIPGNHDRYVADRAATMERAWAPWMRGDDGSDGFPFLRCRGPVAFIGLDSAAPAPLLLATGRLGEAQRDRLAALLDATGAAGYARVVLVHHAPLPGVDPWRKRLVDAPQLAELLGEHGAELVLYGHGHRLRLDRLTGPRGPIPVVQAPSASAAASDPEHGAAWLHVAVRAESARLHLTLQARRPAATDSGEVHAFGFPRGG